MMENVITFWKIQVPSSVKIEIMDEHIRSHNSEQKFLIIDDECLRGMLHNILKQYTFSCILYFIIINFNQDSRPNHFL